MFILLQAKSPLLPGIESNAGIAAMALGVLMLVWLMVLRPAKEKRKKRRGDPLAKSASAARSLATERSTERQMASLVLELESLSRRMGGEMDTKAAKLEQLIAQADAAADRLEAAASTSAPAQAKAIVDKVVAGQSGPADSGLAAIAAHRDIYALADAGESTDVISRKVNRPTGEVELILALRGS
ncbi:MAG: hypothetical protein AAGI46_12280 [Planctomycetota bacterium]